tara:strand:+ start:98 stop:415 length:318 start_codon:yes stop_codon:yes gene_type:complete
MKERWNRVIAFLKIKNNKRVGKKYNFYEHRNTHVVFDLKNKKKLILRKHLSNLAYKLHDMNNQGYKTNRDNIIEEFEYGGLEGVKYWVNKELRAFKKNITKTRTA